MKAIQLADLPVHRPAKANPMLGSHSQVLPAKNLPSRYCNKKRMRKISGSSLFGSAGLLVDACSPKTELVGIVLLRARSTADAKCAQSAPHGRSPKRQRATRARACQLTSKRSLGNVHTPVHAQARPLSTAQVRTLPRDKLDRASAPLFWARQQQRPPACQLTSAPAQARPQYAEHTRAWLTQHARLLNGKNTCSAHRGFATTA